MLTCAWTLVVLFVAANTGVSAQTNWYKFDQKFIENNFPSDSATGELHASALNPASSVHRLNRNLCNLRIFHFRERE